MSHSPAFSRSLPDYTQIGFTRILSAFRSQYRLLGDGKALRLIIKERVAHLSLEFCLVPHRSSDKQFWLLLSPHAHRLKRSPVPKGFLRQMVIVELWSFT